MSKIVSFSQSFTETRGKSKAVIAIYVYVHESSCFALWDTGLVIMPWLRY